MLFRSLRHRQIRSLLLLLFLDCPLGWDLPLDYILSMKERKKRFLLESSKEEEEEDPSPFRIRVCVPPLLVWNSTNIWLLVPYIYTANTRNYLVRNIFHTNACFFIFLWGIFGLTFFPLVSSSCSPCSQSPRKTSFALAKNTHPPLSPTHYHFPLFRRRRRHRLPNEEKEIYILLTRSKGGTDQPLSNFPLAILSFPFPFPLFPLFLAFYSGGTLFRIYGERVPVHRRTHCSFPVFQTKWPFLENFFLMNKTLTVSAAISHIEPIRNEIYGVVWLRQPCRQPRQTADITIKSSLYFSSWAYAAKEGVWDYHTERRRSRRNKSYHGRSGRNTKQESFFKGERICFSSRKHLALCPKGVIRPKRGLLHNTHFDTLAKKLPQA